MKFQYIFSVLILLCFSTNIVNAQLQVRNDEFIQIGYEDYRTLSFGEQTTYSPNNGLYAIDIMEGGLNFWKPWPNAQGYGNFVLYLRPDKKVGINTMGSSSFHLDVAGRMRATSYATFSDERLKKNISPIKSGLQKILALNGVTYNYNFDLNKYDEIDITKLSETKQKSTEGDKLEIDRDLHIGLLAQAVQTVVPEVVKEDEKGILSVNYVELIPLLIEAVKEQQDNIEALEAEIVELQAALETSETKSNTSEKTSETQLLNNAPNPFTTETTIAYTVSETDATSKIHVNVYSQEGSLVLTKQATNGIGKKVVTIRGSELKGNGTYFYSLMVNGEVIDSKMMLYVAAK
jgi:hypothetical protein